MTTAAFAIDTRLRPLTALKAVRQLMRDPEDTRQIFVIFRALRGRSGERAFRRFMASSTGQTIIAEKRSLLTVLEDRTALAALPDGSMGRAYLAFMEEENLTANGLVMASESWDEDKVPPEAVLLRERMRDAHDLTHILTGYGRDPLGEMCLLAFMNRHTKNPGQLLIVAMGCLRLPGAARVSVWQAWRNGAKADWFPAQDYEALLARPLADVRRDLNIPAPTRYQAITRP